MVEKENKLSPEQIKMFQLKKDQNDMELIRLKQQLTVWEEDVANDIPTKKLRLQVRGLYQQVEQMEAENKVYAKRLRTGKEVYDELTEKDLKDFEKTKKEEK